MSDSDIVGYQVLARKYRPETFADLVGQDAMVRTLQNAFHAGRIAHAFVMTGIRGTGKTTTARIIAKGMNCIGADGRGKPTTSPCGVCEHCQAIARGCHIDVIEMDAASRTGVGDIREIIDSVHYASTSARYKIYIIDEVHMLSTSAFNALLKTLEEPPEHVKFIFATTEIRKIPVTVLSRCQRFDLRRIEPEDMIVMLGRILEKEHVQLSDEALALIIRASEGSARDAISLLDQAISHGAGETTVDQVRAMLGLADRGRVLDLFDYIMEGNAAKALNELSAQYSDGADPIAVLRDLAEITHWVSVIKITPQAVEDPTVTPDEKIRGARAADRLQMRSLTRMWQMLLKALDEVSSAPNAMMAAEMAIIRLTYIADLPTPDELIKKLQKTSPPSMSVSDKKPQDNISDSQSPKQHDTTPSPISHNNNFPRVVSQGNAQLRVLNEKSEVALLGFDYFEDVLKLIKDSRDKLLEVHIEKYMRIVKYTPGHIEFEPAKDAPADLAQRLSQTLTQATGIRWTISIVNQGGGFTLEEKAIQQRNDLHQKVKAHPLVCAVFDVFPDAEIYKVHTPQPIDVDHDVLAMIDDDENTDWDPFDDD